MPLALKLWELLKGENIVLAPAVLTTVILPTSFCLLRRLAYCHFAYYINLPSTTTTMSVRALRRAQSRQNDDDDRLGSPTELG